MYTEPGWLFEITRIEMGVKDRRGSWPRIWFRMDPHLHHLPVKQSYFMWTVRQIAKLHLEPFAVYRPMLPHIVKMLKWPEDIARFNYLADRPTIQVTWPGTPPRESPRNNALVDLTWSSVARTSIELMGLEFGEDR